MNMNEKYAYQSKYGIHFITSFIAVKSKRPYKEIPTHSHPISQ